MLRKALILILGAALVCSAFAGCGTQPPEPVGSKKLKEGSKIKIGFAALDEAVDFHLNVKKSVIENCSRYGVEVITADNKADPATAVSNVDNLILQDIDVLIEVNTDAATNQVIKEKCDSAGIPVLGVDIPVPDSPTMGANNEESGRLVGRTLGNLAKKNWGGKVDYLFLIDLPRSGEFVKKRMDNVIYGVQEIIRNLPETKIVRVDGKYDANVCMQLTADFLAAHPEARHILIGTISDTEAYGALRAIKKAQRDKDCFMVSHGVSALAVENLKSDEDNCWKAGVAYFPEKYGDYVVPAAIKLAKGEKVPDYILMKHIVITKDNINEYYPD